MVCISLLEHILSLILVIRIAVKIPCEKFLFQTSFPFSTGQALHFLKNRKLFLGCDIVTVHQNRCLLINRIKGIQQVKDGKRLLISLRNLIELC